MHALAEQIKEIEETSTDIEKSLAVQEFLDYLAARLAEEYISIIQNLEEEEK